MYKQVGQQAIEGRTIWRTSAVALVLPDAVTCSKPGYLYLTQGVWFVRRMTTDQKSLSASETGNETQFVPEDTPFKVSVSSKDIKITKSPAKNNRK